MKKVLVTLSTLTTLTISLNTNFINFNNTNNSKSISDAQTSLFNNKNDELNNSNWITNQSTNDKKFYSYDTNYAKTSSNKDYILSNGQIAKDIFNVNSNGDLNYDATLVPDIDKATIDNIKTEMISHRKITSVKKFDDPYSKSIYDNEYFNGDNSSWQYIQFGGTEKHIDISSQSGAKGNVTDSTSLSETSGLYYIAKAVRENKIDQSIANKLANYFISQSSLKDKLNNLTATIINLICTNNDIYQFINKSPFYNDDANYSINYIFDGTNLVDIYYQKWNNNNMTSNLNYSWDKSYPLTNSDSSDTRTLFKWSDYDYDWNHFTSIFSTLSFDSGSSINVKLASGWDSVNKNMDLSNFKLSNLGDNKLDLELDTVVNVYPITFQASFYLKFSHDKDNIYYQWSFEQSPGADETTLNIKLNNVIIKK